MLGLLMSASLVASLVCMYQDHLTAPVSLQLLERPWLPASFPAAAKSCCFQVVRHRSWQLLQSTIRADGPCEESKACEGH
ncbi:hypothetical protein WJX77_012327 [Trebouxia sp. C0004]